jgi:hypothetical protein
MLKIYTKLDDVPEALREHYALVDGRYVPQLSDDHPVLVHNKTLLSEKTTASNKLKEVEADLEAAKATSIPRGHITVAKADAEALDKFKALGKIEDVTAKLTEYDTLKSQSEQRKLEDSRRQAAKVLGYNEEAFIRLPNLPEFEIRGEGDKQTVVAKVKDGDKIVERPAKEFIEASTDVQPFMAALTTKSGVKVSTAGGGNEPASDDGFQWARDFSKQHIEQTKPVADPFAAFQQRQSA